MDPAVRETYLETQVTTATPQRLRLMLIEGALRQARVAQAAWTDGRTADGAQAVARCREIISELVAGIHPDESPVAQQVLGLYLFLFSALTEAQLSSDVHRVAAVIRVLEEEQQTWQAVCQQLPERPLPVKATPTSVEELAPPRVFANWGSAYGPTASLPPAAREELSLEA